jgi:hypothetical protein
MKKPRSGPLFAALVIGSLVVALFILSGIWVDWSLTPCEGHRDLRWSWSETAKANARAKVEENITNFRARRMFHKMAGTPGELWMDCAACNRELDRTLLLESKGL